MDKSALKSHHFINSAQKKWKFFFCIHALYQKKAKYEVIYFVVLFCWKELPQ